jgi:hypothetical protein
VCDDEGKSIAQCHKETIKGWRNVTEEGKSCAQFLLGLSDEQGDDVEELKRPSSGLKRPLTILKRVLARNSAAHTHHQGRPLIVG